MTKHLPSYRPIPSTGMTLPKEKSTRWKAILQKRLIIRHFDHPSAYISPMNYDGMAALGLESRSRTKSRGYVRGDPTLRNLHAWHHGELKTPSWRSSPPLSSHVATRTSCMFSGDKCARLETLPNIAQTWATIDVAAQPLPSWVPQSGEQSLWLHQPYIGRILVASTLAT